MAGPELAKRYQTILYLAGSASAEFFADIALCPFEAVKVQLGVGFLSVSCHGLIALGSKTNSRAQQPTASP